MDCGCTPIVNSEAGPRLPRAYHVTWSTRVQNLLLAVKTLDLTTRQRNSPLDLLRSFHGSSRRKMWRKCSVEKVSIRKAYSPTQQESDFRRIRSERGV